MLWSHLWHQFNNVQYNQPIAATKPVIQNQHQCISVQLHQTTIIRTNKASIMTPYLHAQPALTVNHPQDHNNKQVSKLLVNTRQGMLQCLDCCSSRGSVVDAASKHPKFHLKRKNWNNYTKIKATNINRTMEFYFWGIIPFHQDFSQFHHHPQKRINQCQKCAF